MCQVGLYLRMLVFRHSAFISDCLNFMMKEKSGHCIAVDLNIKSLLLYL